MGIIDSNSQTAPIDEGDLADGVHFNLDEKIYHALPRLSASGINNMLVSPATFWFESWLNPDKKDEDTPARVLGRAYHTARLEPHKFDAQFACELEPKDFEESALMNDEQVKAAIKEIQPKKEDHPNALFTDGDVKNALDKMGRPKQVKDEKAFMRYVRLRECGYEGEIWHEIVSAWESDFGKMIGPSKESSLERAERLKSYGYTGAIYSLEFKEWETAKGDRTPIPAQYWRDIQTDMERLRSNPEIAELFTGGAAEVSILWTCAASGQRMKARVDYLKPDRIVDLKTFQNSSRKRLDQCVADAFRYNRYYIQASAYWGAVELIRDRKLEIVGQATGEEKQLINHIQTNPRPMQSWYVFQEKGGVPNLVAYEIGLLNVHASAAANEGGLDDETVLQRARDAVTSPSGLMLKAQMEIRHAKAELATYREVYDDGEPWQPITPLRKLDDTSFNGFWLDEGR